MKFERGKSPKDALNIGVVAKIKNDIIAVIPEIMAKYVFEFFTTTLAEHIENEIETFTGHKVKVEFVGLEPELMIIVDKPELKKRIRIKAKFSNEI